MESLTIIQKIFLSLFTGLIGLAIGSFLNVVALRLLSKEDFVQGRSKCPKCEHLIAWYDNIPVISYILLGGKCRKCNERISIQYPVVEIITAVLFVVLVGTFGISLKTLFLIFLTCNLIVITITDIREKYIFDINSIPIIPIGLAYNFFNIGQNSAITVNIFGISFNDVFISAVIAAIAGAVFFEVFSRIGLLLAGEYAFGTGDSILAAALGAWFGWKLLIIILILSFISQIFVGVPAVVYSMHKDKDYKSIWAMGTLLFSMVFTFLGRYFTAKEEPFIALAMILLSFVIAGISIYFILKRARERQSYTFLPFGPSMVLGAFIVMFFGANFIGYFH